MENTRKITNKYKCEWIEPLFKELLAKKDLKLYNRMKRVVYYFPEILKETTKEDFKTAFMYADETYICIGKDDKRYSVFDEIYKNKNGGQEFEAPTFGEGKYISIEEMCKYFSI